MSRGRIDYGQVPACPDGGYIRHPFAEYKRVSTPELKRGANWLKNSMKWIPADKTNMKKRFGAGAKALVGYNPKTRRWRVLQVREPVRRR